MSYTKGPWTVRRRAYDYAVDSAAGLICAVHNTKRNNNFDDATLIAAATDLLEACRLALWGYERAELINWGVVELAIAKATGGAK
jgi:hypothetical protein